MYSGIKNLQFQASVFGLHLIIVGGAIRDMILYKTESLDIDIEVHPIQPNIKIDEFLSHYYQFANVFKGKSLPFEIFKFKFKNYDIEISPPRIEKFIEGNDEHKNFEIDISTTKEFDTLWKRRDFTINSIGFDLLNETIIDPFDGRKDLNNGVLRPASDNFTKDYVRLFRAIRFSILLDFDLPLIKKSISSFSLSKISLYHLVKEGIKSKNFLLFIEKLESILAGEKIDNNLSDAFLLFKKNNIDFEIKTIKDLELYISKLSTTDRDKVITLLSPFGIISKKRILKL
jgi:tRNA nucleotidyltransferase (CCA-adding enzyme)